MNSLRLAAVAVLVAGFGLLTPSAASADDHDTEYAQCDVTLSVDPDSLDGAGSVEGVAKGSPDGGDIEVSNDFNGEDESGGSSTDFEFSFPKVDDDEEVTITAEYTTSEGIECSDSETVELEGQDEDGDGEDEGDEEGNGDGDEKSSGDLPDTGGPDSMIIGTGITLMLVGAGIVYFFRRRNQDAV